jgi:hypothetical protein
MGRSHWLIARVSTRTPFPLFELRTADLSNRNQLLTDASGRPMCPMTAFKSTPASHVEEFLCRNLRDDYSSHFRIKPTNAVSANDKVGRIEDLAFDEIQHPALDLRPIRLH